MIPLLILLSLGASYVEQDIPDLSIGELNRLTGAATPNYRLADMNGDGLSDLILPTAMLLQENGTYAVSSPIPIPGIAEEPLCDSTQNTLYLLFSDRIQILQYIDSAWKITLDHEVAWPEDAGIGVSDSSSAQAGVRFSRFLHDLDRDSIPEIVIPDSAGLHIYRQSGAVLFKANTLHVYPAAVPSVTEPVRLWPPGERLLQFPPRKMACTLNLHENKISVTSRQRVGLSQVIYHITQYTVLPDEAFALDHVSVERLTSPPMPEFMEPCRLNDDDILDFAGGTPSISSTSLFPVPIYTTAASTNAGQTKTVRRDRSFRPSHSFSDIDHDGDLDMITQRIDLFDRGMRESLSRLLSDKRIGIEIKIYRQLKTTFEEMPSLRATYQVVLDNPPGRNTPRFESLRNGDLMDLTGDFNGDGQNDLLLRQKPGEVCLYFHRGGRFSRRPDIVLPNPQERLVRVADINADGFSDVILTDHSNKHGAEGMSTKVYFLSGGNSP